MLTRSSVHCAERIVATSSSSGLRWSSAHRASGYAALSRRKTAAARRFFSSRVSSGACSPSSRHSMCRIRACADPPSRSPPVLRGSRSRRLADVTLTILHTSDLHGRVHPHDALADRDLGEGLARVAAAVKAIRAEGSPVLLLDSGDTIQGAPEQALAFDGRAGDGSDPIVRRDEPHRLRRDGDRQPRVRLRKGAAQKPRQRQRSSPGFRPTRWPPATRRSRRTWCGRSQGVRVGILGLVTNQVGRTGSVRRCSRRLRFTEPVGDRETLGSGPARTRSGATSSSSSRTRGSNATRRPARNRGGGGREPRLRAGDAGPGDRSRADRATRTRSSPRSGSAATWVSQPGRWGKTLTRYDLTLVRKRRRRGRWRVVRGRRKSLPMKKVLPDPEIVASVAVEHEAAMQVLAEKVADLTSAGLDAAASGSRTRRCSTGSTRVQLARRARPSSRSPRFCRPSFPTGRPGR